jgi:isopentenyl-diphosphate delta-isomerase
LPIIATGGIRSGLDVAKSIALGASVGSAALPFLKPAIRSSGEVLRRIRTMEEELKIAMFLTGCESIEKLRSVRVILGWRVKEWMS